MKNKYAVQFLSLLLIFVLTVSYLPTDLAKAAAASQISVTIDNAVVDEINRTGSATYWVDFKNEADLSSAYSMNWNDRGWYVYETLQAQAEQSQASVKAYLSNAGISFQSFWIKNTIYVQNSNKVVLSALQYLPNVTAIRGTKNFIVYEPEKDLTVQAETQGIEPNIAHVQAPEVWALGYTGQGITVSSVDTGVRYTHQALVGKYRGNMGGGNFTHDYNWFDPYGEYVVPTDTAGHGTHTMGTMVGDDGGSNQIGMAPGAQWMACRGCNTSNCTDLALLTCGEFIAAPTTVSGSNPDPTKRPNVVNNSWGDCSQSYDPWYAEVVTAWQAGGIYPVFSNGNSSNCGYSSPPGLNTVGNPARYGNVTGVGSSGESNGQYATHSNWGPTDNLDTVNPTDGFDMMKPQVLAPGVSIRSSVPTSDTSYQDGWTGTSMSAPHVTGLVALIWQAAPCLVGDFATTENLIESSATDIVYDDHSPITPTNFPNFATGWGEIDALAAVNAAAGLCGNSILTGTVTSDSGVPLEGATVTVTGTDPANHRSVRTNDEGIYSANINADTFTVAASLVGYKDASVSGVVVPDEETVVQDLVLIELPHTKVSGTVYDGGVSVTDLHGIPLYAKLTFKAPGYSETVYTDPITGQYQITLYHDQPYDVQVETLLSGYLSVNEIITPSDEDVYDKDFTLMVNTAVCAAPGYEPDYVYFYDFEGSDDSFVASGTNSSWAWGNITSGPGKGHIGTEGWATNLSGHYNKNELSYLTSPVIDLSSLGIKTPALQWWQWMRIESVMYDNGMVEVTKDGGATWLAVWGPVGGVSDSTYNQNTIILDPSYNVSNFQFRFKFKSDYGIQYEGWYIDDIGIVGLPIPPLQAVASYNFDSSNNGFTVSGQNPSWAWGAPIANPDTAHSEPNVWGTNLNGNYKSYERSYLTSPVIDLSPYTGSTISITFWTWMDIEDVSYDWGEFQVTKDGGTTWQMFGNKYGDQHTWRQMTVDIDPSYAVSNFRFRFFMQGVYNFQYSGWSIDDVVVGIREGYSLEFPCNAISGGYLAGYIYDANFPTSKVPGAKLSNPTASMLTFPTVEDEKAEGLYWLFQPTSSDSADAECAVTANKYVTKLEVVSVNQNAVISHDFYLDAGKLALNPTSIVRTIFLHDDPETTTLNILNSGTGDATFKMSEKDKGFQPLAISIPAVTVPVEKRDVQASMTPDPNPQTPISTASPFGTVSSTLGIQTGPVAYGVSLIEEMLVKFPDLSVPVTWEEVGSVPTILYAGDFLGDDFSKLYGIDDQNKFYTVDTSTGASTLIGTVTPPAGETITGISGADGFFYGVSTDCSARSTLFQLDPSGEITVIGVPEMACAIDLAYVPSEDAIYSIDLVTDSTYRIDPATGAATLLGPTGIDADFAQGMDYDEESGVLYWASYSTYAALRVVDMTTGATAEVGPLPDEEVDALAIATGGVTDILWLSEAPVEGSAAANSSTPIALTFDVASIEQPGDFFAELKVNHNTPYPMPVDTIPVTLHVVRPFTWGNIKGDIIATEKCDLNPAPLAEATINFYQNDVLVHTTQTDADGHYSYAMLNGIYDVEVISAGYVSQKVTEVNLGVSADVVVNFNVRLDSACLTLDPSEFAAVHFPDQVSQQILTFTNTGAREATYGITEFPLVTPSVYGDIELILDDGTAEDALGLNSQGQFLFFNRFTPESGVYPFNLEEVHLIFVDDVPVGDPVQIVVYSDDDHDPTNGATYIGGQTFEVQYNDLATFNVFSFTEPILIEEATDVLIGAVHRASKSIWPAAMDTDSTNQRSWLAIYSGNPPDIPPIPSDESFALVDDFGHSCNWTLRGMGSAANGDIVWLTEDVPSGVVSPDGGTLEVMLTFDSQSLLPGEYMGKLMIKNLPDPKISIPVHLTVNDYLHSYLPMLMK